MGYLFIILLCLVLTILSILSKKRIYLLLVIGMLCGFIYLCFEFYEFSGYIRRISMIFYLIFLLFLSPLRRKD